MQFKILFLCLIPLLSSVATNNALSTSSLKQGMTMGEVQSLLGPPTKTEFSGDLTAWHYCQRDWVSHYFVIIIFNIKKIVEVRSYKLPRPENGKARYDCSLLAGSADFSSANLSTLKNIFDTGRIAEDNRIYENSGSRKREFRETKYDNNQPNKRYYVIMDSSGNYIEDGPSVSWWKSGHKTEECTYKNGMYDGKYVTWYENGQKSEERSYKNGKEDGLSIGWFEDGKKDYEGTFKDGQPDGKAYSWYKNGNKSLECIYKDGKLNGLETKWNEQGNKIEEFFYKDGIIIK